MNAVPFVWKLGRLTIEPVTRLFAPLRVYGAERIPPTGGVVLAMNHFSWIDPPAFGAAVPRIVYFMAKSEVYKVPGLGQLIESFGAFSVRRGESDRVAVRRMKQVVADGHALGLFVEGTRQKGGAPRRGHARGRHGRRAGRRAGRLRGHPRLAVLEAGELPPGLDRVERADALRRHPSRGEGLPRSLGSHRRGDLAPLALADRDARARPPAGRDTAGVSTDLLGTVAVVGFPNVGKSTLVNRLTGTRTAVVHETPGVTRDRKELTCEWSGHRFRLIDTGGVDIVDPSPLTAQVADQARAAIAEADLILFVVDAQIGITPGDEEIASILRRAHKPVFLIANKIDEPGNETAALEFHRLGLGDPIALSSLHGHGTGDLLDLIIARLPGSGPAEVGDDAIRVAILGRPNVGKSSLLNALLGEERVIVSETPGTTRDSIDTVLKRGDRTFVLVDTAGLRRKRRARQGIEYYSELRALQAAERADVAVVLIDASEGIVDHDLTVADVARKAQDSTLVALNKWDIGQLGIEDARARIAERLRQRPPVVTVSATTGRGVSRLLDYVERLYDKHTARVPTPELNRFLGELREARQPPSKNGKSLNLLYGTQTTVRPPRFRFFVNDPSLVTRDYGYWVENQLRERFQMEGVPVSIDFVRKT